MIEGKSRFRRLKGALLLIGILVLGSVVALFVMHQQKAPSGQSGDAAAIKQKAAILLEGVRHMAVKDGVKDWSLDAESADYRLEDNEAVFRSLQVAFYSKGGDDVFLSAASGTWHTESNDLDVTGHVVIKNKQYELRADKVTYIHAKRMFVSRTPVTIMGEALKLAADQMKYNLDSNIFFLDGNVAGIIGRNIEL